LAETFLWVVCCLLGAAPALLSMRAASAAPWSEESILELEQPEIEPRRAMDAPFVYTYASPDTTKSFPHARWEAIAQEVYRQELIDDPRIRWTGALPVDLPAQALAQQSAE